MPSNPIASEVCYNSIPYEYVSLEKDYESSVFSYYIVPVQYLWFMF